MYHAQIPDNLHSHLNLVDSCQQGLEVRQSVCNVHPLGVKESKCASGGTIIGMGFLFIIPALYGTPYLDVTPSFNARRCSPCSMVMNRGQSFLSITLQHSIIISQQVDISTPKSSPEVQYCTFINILHKTKAARWVAGISLTDMDGKPFKMELQDSIQILEWNMEIHLE